VIAERTAGRRWAGPAIHAGMRRHRRLAWVGALFALPATAFFVVWVFFPTIYEVWVSGTNDNLLTPPQFTGVQSYGAVLASPLVWEAAEHTLEYALLSVVPTLAIALAVAVLMHRVRRGTGPYQILLFLPVIVPSVAAALVWELILQPAGLVNQILRLDTGWLTDPAVAMVSIALVTIWSGVGYYLVVFLAGLQAIPDELLQAASVDGAGGFATVWHIVVPQLRPTILFATTTCTAAVITNFTLPYVMTGGGPGDITLTLPLLVYQDAFSFSQAGQASALALMLLVATLGLTLLQFRLLGGWNDAEA
jgi:putative chitobiose transport system permease protein